MEIPMLHQLSLMGVNSLELTEASFKALKGQVSQMFPEHGTINYKKEDGKEEITIFKIKVWSKLNSGIVLN